jgi:signal peptidase I
MAPSLLPGDRLLVLRWLPRSRPRPGDVVILHDPECGGRFLVKRVRSPDPSGLAPPISAVSACGPMEPRYTVCGDNTAQSRDSRHFGPVLRARIVGRAVWRYLPGSRQGRIAFPPASR